MHEFAILYYVGLSQVNKKPSRVSVIYGVHFTISCPHPLFASNLKCENNHEVQRFSRFLPGSLDTALCALNLYNPIKAGWWYYRKKWTIILFQLIWRRAVWAVVYLRYIGLTKIMQSKFTRSVQFRKQRHKRDWWVGWLTANSFDMYPAWLVCVYAVVTIFPLTGLF